MNTGFNFCGLKIICDDSLADWKQVKFPRSKKKRICRKWAKNQKNYAYIPKNGYYQIGDMLIMHPTMLESLKREIDKQNECNECQTRYI